ncbi:MAG: hypothetical protein ACE5D3_07760, partial [Candidatus Binatia bacterium]
MARAAVPPVHPGEADFCTLEIRSPGDSASEVRALPPEREDAPCPADLEHIAFVALKVGKPELPRGDACRRVAGLGDVGSRDCDNAAETLRLQEIEEA